MQISFGFFLFYAQLDILFLGHCLLPGIASCFVSWLSHVGPCIIELIADHGFFVSFFLLLLQVLFSFDQCETSEFYSGKSLLAELVRTFRDLKNDRTWLVDVDWKFVIFVRNFILSVQSVRFLGI